MTENLKTPAAGILAYRILLGVFFTLLTVFLAGSVYGLVKRGFSGGGKEAGTAAGQAGSVEGESEAVFSGIGTLRIETAGDQPVSLIISVAFPYNQNDRPFTEELVSRIDDFKAITSEYLGSFTAEELQTMDVSAISAELLGRYNALLRLGAVKELYFLDFIWL